MKNLQFAPNLTLAQLDGTPISLNTYWGSDHHLLLIFLRHLA